MKLRIALVVAVLALVLTAGCIGAEDPAPTLDEAGDSEDVEGNATESFEVTLASFPEGADWIAVDIWSPEHRDANYSLHASEAYTPNPELRHCMYLGSTGAPLQRATMGGQADVRVTARPLVEDPIVREPGNPLDRGWELGGAPGLSLGNDTRATILFGFHDASRWQEEGAQVQLTVESPAPVRWQIRDAGSMMCQPRLTDYEGGTLIETGTTRYGEDLTSTFAIEGEGYGFVFPHSDGRHDFSLEGPNGTVWEEAKTTATDGITSGELWGGKMLEGLPAGSYEATVHEILGHTSVGASLMVTDVPSSVAEDLRETNETE